MSKIYLKTYFYVPHEIKFLKLNLIESYPHIDKFIICEFNRAHTGRPTKHGYIFEDHIDEFPEELRDKILYLKCDISKEVVDAYNDESAIHRVNEPLMRGYFVSQMDLDDEDIIISVDADEIVYGDKYPEIIEKVKEHDLVQLNFHQMFWKMNWLWKDYNWEAVNASKYKVYKNEYPAQFRYDGHRGLSWSDVKCGVHFSWCLPTTDDMIYKLHTYSHPSQRHAAKKEILEDAVKNQKFPFDPREFEIEELEWDDPILPKNLHKVIKIEQENEISKS